MIRVSIIADTLERAQSLAEALGDIDRLEAIDSDSGFADLTIAIGLTLARIHRLHGPLVVISDAKPHFGPSIHAWLPLNASIAEIEAAVLAATHDLLVLTPEQGRHMLRDDRTEDDITFVEALTPRELQVLRMLADGLGNKEIAAELGISEHTAKFHVSQILAKLGATSRAEAVATGIRRGLVPI